LIGREATAGVVGPPCANVTTQLLHSEESLPHFDAAQEPELGLHHPKPVISLERLSTVKRVFRTSMQHKSPNLDSITRSQ
jgi:hypothetical protein